MFHAINYRVGNDIDFSQVKMQREKAHLPLTNNLPTFHLLIIKNLGLFHLMLWYVFSSLVRARSQHSDVENTTLDGISLSKSFLKLQ